VQIFPIGCLGTTSVGKVRPLRLAVVAATIAALVCLSAARAAMPAPGPTDQLAPDAGSCDTANFRIVLDVGHTVEAGGATSARGVPEYVFNLRLAKLAEKYLHEAGFVRINLMVTRGVGRLQLLRRSARANDIGADLFVSIHHDSVQDSYLARWQHDGRIDRFSDRFRGYSIFISNDNARSAESLDFARLLGDALIARDMHFTTHHAEDIAGERHQLVDPERGIYRYDELIVLQNTRAPSVLLEAGVIVNRAEETDLASPTRQRAIAAAIVAATVRFCALQGARGQQK
jgi:N-acetylmuramoyl-L-alanine amidase